jgi:hypothetical protein
VEVLHARGGGGGRSRPAPSRRVPHRRRRADPREASSASPAQRRVPGGPEGAGDVPVRRARGEATDEQSSPAEQRYT